MDSREARRKFKLADELYRDKHYTEALTVLEKLDAEFPDAKNVMYPRALCLMKLGRAKEAHEVCYKLKTIHNDPRADALLQKLASSIPQASPPPLFDPNVLDQDMALKPMDLSMVPIGTGGADPMGLGDLFAPKPGAAPAVVPPAGPNRKPLYIGLGVVGAVLLLALIALPLFVERSDDTEIADDPLSQPAVAQEGTPQEIYWFNSYDTAMNASYEKSAPMLLFFYNSGSDDATRMMQETWKEPSITHLVQGWTCVRIDTEAEPDLAQVYEVTEVPTTIVQDDRAGPVFQQSGYLSAQEFYNAVQPLDLQVYEMPKLTLVDALGMILIGVIQATFGMYLTLLMVRKLPHDDFLRDIISSMLVGMGCAFLLGACSCVGLVAVFFILRSAYEFEFLDYVAYLGVNFVLGALSWILVAAMIGLPIAESFEFFQNL